MRKQQSKASARKNRARSASSAARGDDREQLTVAYNWFLAELAAFVRHPAGNTDPAALLAKHVREAAEMVNKMNEELDHGR